MDKANSKICSVIEFQSLGTENENFFMSSRHSRLRWTGGRSIARIFKMIQVCGLNGEGLVNQNHTLPCSWDQKLNSCPLWCLSILFFRVRVGGQRRGGGGGGSRRTGDGSDANKLVFKSQLVENSVDITQTASLQN